MSYLFSFLLARLAAAARAARVLQQSHHAQTRINELDRITPLPERPKITKQIFFLHIAFETLT